MDLANAIGRYLVPRGRENLAAWDGERRGHYEVWYLTFNVPGEGAAFWLRYTLDSPDRGEPFAELWGHFFDGQAPMKSIGLRQRFPRSELSLGGEGIIRIGGAELREGGAKGSLERGGHSLEWQLEWQPCPTAFFIAPSMLRPFLGRKRTQWCVPNIDLAFHGRVVADGRRFELSGERGQQAHLFGRQHAESWAWVHCNSFDGGRKALVEGVAAELLLPFGMRRVLTAVYVRLDGEDFLCNALPRSLSARSERGLDEWRFWCSAKGTQFIGHARGDRQKMLQVAYEDPDGTASYCCNTELGELVLEVHRPDAAVERLTATGTAHLELGSRQPRTDVRLCEGP
ncbi:MAG: hypothetical protein HYZ28_26475 [Myxococcales bacterium]|nr:hypothetical protein [Myxococcales bacterium]